MAPVHTRESPSGLLTQWTPVPVVSRPGPTCATETHFVPTGIGGPVRYSPLMATLSQPRLCNRGPDDHLLLLPFPHRPGAPASLEGGAGPSGRVHRHAASPHDRDALSEAYAMRKSRPSRRALERTHLGRARPRVRRTLGGSRWVAAGEGEEK